MASIEYDPEYFLLKGPSFPSAEEAPRMIGRIVKNFAQPLAGYVPEDASLYRDKDKALTHTRLGSASRFANSERKEALRVTFLSLIDSHVGGSSNRKAWLRANEIHAYELPQQEDVFERLIAQDEVTRALSKWQKSQGVPGYMIVGVLTWKEASLGQVDKDAQHTGAGINLPTGLAGSAAIAATTGTMIDPRVIGDIGARGLRGHGVQTGRTADIAESKIFAVQCLNIRRRGLNVFTPATYELGSRGPRIPEDRKYGDVIQEDLDTAAKTSKEEKIESETFHLDQSLNAWTDIVYEDNEDADLIGDNVEFDGRSIRIVCDLGSAEKVEEDKSDSEPGN